MDAIDLNKVRRTSLSLFTFDCVLRLLPAPTVFQRKTLLRVSVDRYCELFCRSRTSPSITGWIWFILNWSFCCANLRAPMCELASRGVRARLQVQADIVNGVRSCRVELSFFRDVLRDLFTFFQSRVLSPLRLQKSSSVRLRNRFLCPFFVLMWLAAWSRPDCSHLGHILVSNSIHPSLLNWEFGTFSYFRVAGKRNSPLSWFSVRFRSTDPTQPRLPGCRTPPIPVSRLPIGSKWTLYRFWAWEQWGDIAPSNAFIKNWKLNFESWLLSALSPKCASVTE